MTWYYRNPNTFPSAFFEVINSACAQPGIPVPMNSGSRADLLEIAEKFRYFKWCVKQGGIPIDILKLFTEFDIRTLIKDNILSLTAREHKLTVFARLNPELAAEIFSNVK